MRMRSIRVMDFLAENARFAEICGEHEIKFIGPTPAMINAMGDKITAKETMIKAGVPVVPGGEGLLESLDEAKGLAKEIGYPIILKATAGRRWKRHAGGLGGVGDGARL